MTGLLAFLALAACSSTNNGRVDVSLTWSSPREARTYGLSECARRSEAGIVRVHFFDAAAGDPDNFQEIDVHCRRASAP